MSSQQEEAIVLENLEQIRKGLLNLNPRNRLLHYKTNKKSIKFLNDASNIYENLVLSEKKLPIEPLPDLNKMWDIDYEDEGQGKKDYEEAFRWFCNDYDSSKDEKPCLQSFLEAEVLEGRLRKIRSDFDLAINETGLNLLHIALGFLKWRDVDQTERWYEAPLILIPVTIAKDKYVVDSDMYQYRISYEGEDLQKNICLSEKMRLDFGIAIPDLWETADEDNSERKFNPSGYYKRVTKAINAMHEWEVVESNYIAFFHFTKQRMYHDLDPEHWISTETGLLKHELIQDILLGKNVEPGQSVVPKEYDIDFSEEANNIPLVLDTDSSQHSVLVDAMSDKNMVVQGPPGTGKSQTITNLICSAISTGKSILFMSEKMAALDVVMRNMKKVGLSDFCLELHSKKALKKSIMESLKKRRKANYDSDITTQT